MESISVHMIGISCDTAREGASDQEVKSYPSKRGFCHSADATAADYR